MATDLEAAWRRINWPTLGCVAAPPQRLGGAWYVQLQGVRGDGLLVHVRGQARVVHDRFTAHVLSVAAELRALSDRMDFAAGQYHLIELADGCHVLMSTPDRGALLLPVGSTARAAQLGEELQAFPWKIDLQPNQIYSVSLLVATDVYPGYVSASTAHIATTTEDPHRVDASSDGGACSTIEPTLQRLAAKLSASSQRHLPPKR